MSDWQRRCGYRFLALAAFAVSVAAGARDAAAVVPMPTGFALDISPSARLLDALDANRDGDMTATQLQEVQYDESCDNPLLRIRARNKPALMITNFDSSAAPITSFTLEINGTNDYIFGNGDSGDSFDDFIKNTIYNDAGVTITGSSLSADKKTLTVNFDGLTAGKKAVFNLDLDSSDPNEFQYPDYRMVLCGTPTHPTTPATATATFVDSGSPIPNSDTKVINFAPTSDPTFWETQVRPYHTMDKMELREMAIPEPSAALLSLAGAALLAVRRRRA